MPQEVKLAKTARDKILEPYEAAGRPHEFRTTPVSVSGQMKGSVVATAAMILAGYAWLKFLPQVVKLARKGIGDQMPFGDSEVDATEAETNLQRGGSTDGARDMAIEGLQVTSLGQIVNYFDGGPVTGFSEAPTDEVVRDALNGKGLICDPFGLVVPPQIQSPYLLEEALFTALMRASTLELKLDTSRPYQLGSARLYPGNAGQSMLRANGLPTAGNQFTFPEGIVWRRDGEADSDLTLTVELKRPVVMPISLVTLPGGQARTAPVEVYQRFAIDILGVSVSELGEN